MYFKFYAFMVLIIFEIYFKIGIKYFECNNLLCVCATKVYFFSSWYHQRDTVWFLIGLFI